VGVLDEPPPDPLLGSTLMERYVVERKLGEGGMGAVYVARHLVLDKPVALKVLHGELMRKPELRERFLNEARAASRIRHENVIDITDFGTTPEGAVFFAMELLNGRDLHAELFHMQADGQRLPWSRARAIFLQVCSALSAAHRLGIIHRDLKPENIYLIEWLGHRDFVKLLDFGIAKSTEVPETERKLTRTGMLFGTPEYMAPEQARGETPDHRVDVYAMGCILYQLVSGRVPFSGDSFMAILAQHLAQPVPPLDRAVLAEIGAPSGLDAVVQRALDKDRDQRYPSIDALAAAVRSAEDAARIRRPSAMQEPGAGGLYAFSPIAAYEPSATEIDSQPPPPRRRIHPLAIFAAVGLVAILVGVAVAVLAGGSDEAAAPAQPVASPEQPAPAAPAPATPVDAPESPPVTAQPAASPDKTEPAARPDDRPRREPRRKPDKPATPAADEELRLGDVKPKDPFQQQDPAPKPSDAKPGEAKPADGKSGDAKPVEAKPGDAASKGSTPKN
jgi:eukaryotic-like serine/threonine-protein kinase